jgi:hypothetical protein
MVKRHPRRDDSFDGGAKTAVKIRGSLNDDSDTDRGWTVELAVPFSRLGRGTPRPGTQWRLNLFRLDDRQNAPRAFLAWSTPLANTTHVTNRFGRITFGPIAPAAHESVDENGREAGPAIREAGLDRSDSSSTSSEER